jgi:hypothetical protein
MPNKSTPSGSPNDKFEKGAAQIGKRHDDAGKHDFSPDSKAAEKANHILIFLGVLNAGGLVLFWAFADFFESHNSPILSHVSFFALRVPTLL